MGLATKKFFCLPSFLSINAIIAMRCTRVRRLKSSATKLCAGISVA
ncbi:hypothetical protein M2360_003805 [Rhizobium sp. SG_E_25_P2]|nr:hypothetical protein [Rhizobium sp. SG_E_25_P2]